MKSLLNIILVLVTLGAAAFFYSPAIQMRVKPIVREIVPDFLQSKPCAQPLTYTLTKFDDRFDISKEYFLSALSDAEAIWEKPTGKNLFSYEEQGGEVKVNLVYDYRQEATGKLSSLGIIVHEDQASYNSLKEKYISLKAQYGDIKKAFDAQVAAFDARNEAYIQKVKYWNDQGGAPRKEFEQLEAEQRALNIQSSGLQSTQANLNNIVSEMNSLVVVLNRLANTLNLAVNEYNSVGASRGETFDEGQYKNSSSGQEINIYEFSNRQKLVRVLAHELGHALGLDHVLDPDAIMYAFNNSKNFTPTDEDISALNTLCHDSNK